jgi:hypothetical protein
MYGITKCRGSYQTKPSPSSTTAYMEHADHKHC